MPYSITPTSAQISEGAGSITFTITRTGSTATETVFFSTTTTFGSSNGADYGIDTSYTGVLNRPLTFTSTVQQHTVTVLINNDSAPEPNEVFGVLLDTSSGTVLASTTFTIVDNGAAQSTQYALTPAATAVTEGGQVTFTVTRSGSLPSETVWFSARADGTATWSEGDFSTTSGGQPLNIPVVFGTGVTSQSVTLNIASDGVSDSGEQFRAIVQRNSSDNASTFLAQSAFVTINDPVQSTQYALTPSVTAVTEGGQVTFTVTRSGSLPSETVWFSARADGTATWSEGDFSTTSGGQPLNVPVVFGTGVTSQSVTLNIASDGVSDSGEQFRAIVQRNSSDNASTFLAQSAFVTINDPVQSTQYGLTPSVTTVAEGGQVTFTITRTGDRPQETVYFSAWADSASYDEGDYRMSNGAKPENIAVDFLANEASRTVTMSILGDGASDSGERFRAIVQRSPPSVDPADNVAQTGFITINDPAQGTQYSLTPSPTAATEGGQVTFTVTRSGSLPSETVWFSTLAGGTATHAEGDYTTTSGGQPLNIPVVFSAGATSQTVTLNITSDGVSDSGEQFRAIVQRNSSDDASTFLVQSAFVTINDAAQSTHYALAPSATAATEGGQVTFTITRSGNLPSETVWFSTLADGTATYAEGDYTTTSGGQPLNIPVVFGADATSQTVTLSIANDGVSDSGERFRAIVQRNSSDAPSDFLDRSDYVVISDVTYTEDPESTGILSYFLPIAYAAEKTPEPTDGFRYPIGSGAFPASEGWSTSQDLGTFFTTDRWHLGEDWNKDPNVGVPGDDAGTNVMAVYGGRVVYANFHPSPGASNGFGNTVVIEHNFNGEIYYSLYAHLATIDSAFLGASVDAPIDIEKGSTLGTIGQTGATNNSHLHLEIFELSNGDSFLSYLTSGTPIGHRWGYTDQPSAAATEPSPSPTSIASYTEGNFTWYNPSIFIDNSFQIASGDADGRNAFFGFLENAASTLTKIEAWGSDVLLTADEIAQIILKGFQELHITGSLEGDTLNIGDLSGTTIDQNTVYFDGGEGGDTLDGTATDRRVVAEGGLDDDTLSGGLGNDQLIGGSGADSLYGGPGDDLLYSYAVDFDASVAANDGLNLLDGGDDNDELRGSGAAERLLGGAGNDLLAGRGGADHIDGGDGIDLALTSRSHLGTPYTFNFAPGVGGDITEPEGARLISIERVQFSGGTGAETVTGGSNDDLLRGGGGNDVLSGNGGTDRLDGEAGNDTLDGGDGLDVAVFIGNRADYALAGTATSFRITDSVAGRDGTDTVRRVEVVSFADGTFSVSDFLPPGAAPNDFNGDGTTDILVSSAGGAIVAWTIEDGTLSGAPTYVATAAGGWSYLDTGDFNGDGTSDILVTNAGGAIVAWTIEDGTLSGAPTYVATAAGGWSYLDTGDFNGDGTSDILVTNAGGAIVAWTIEDGTLSGAPTYVATATGGWSYLDTGDFNGDGTSDILVTNTGGAIVDWTIENGTLSGAPTYVATATGGWSYLDTGDFNGDGTSDILVTNTGGAIVDWTIENGTLSGAPTYVATATGGWSYLDTGDFNRDGTSDILVTNAGGAIVDWTIENGTLFGVPTYIGTATDGWNFLS